MQKFAGFHSDTAESVLAAFSAEHERLTDDEVIFAEYTEQDWSGSAWVLFKRDGQLYEVHGSHCSCHGLEDQWEPEETALEAIMMRPLTGYSVDASELRQWILVNVLENVTVGQLAGFLQSNDRHVREAAMMMLGKLKHHAA